MKIEHKKDKLNEIEYAFIKVGNVEIQVIEHTEYSNDITVVAGDCDVPINMHILKCDQGMSYMPTVTFSECKETDERITISDD